MRRSAAWEQAAIGNAVQRRHRARSQRAAIVVMTVQTNWFPFLQQKIRIMAETKKVRRVVVIVDNTLTEQLLEKIVELGAKGYNCTRCSGKGTHAVSGTPFQEDGLTRIEVLCNEDTGEKIVNYIHAVQFQQFGRYALSAYSDYVEVDVRDTSLTGE